MFPSVRARVTEFQPAFDEAKTDAPIRVFVYSLREIAVSAVEVESFAVTVEAKVHMAGSCDTHPVLEGIFYDGNEDVRSDLHLLVGC